MSGVDFVKLLLESKARGGWRNASSGEKQWRAKRERESEIPLSAVMLACCVSQPPSHRLFGAAGHAARR